MSNYILGINSAYHESAACMIKDGKILAAVEEERFNRKKHAKKAKVSNPDELPLNAINYCLKKAGIKLKDVDHIGFSFTPEKRLKNIGVDKYFVKGDWGSKEGEELFYKKIKTVPEKLGKLAGKNMKNKFHWIDHHLCHAASAFFVSPYKESIIIVSDGIGEFATAWVGYGKDNKIHKIKEIFYPHSLGFLWEKMSEFLGFTGYDAGKVMGLSSYGDYKAFYDHFHKIVNFDEKNIFTIDNDIMRFRTDDFSQIERLFRVKRRMKNDPIEKVHKDIAAGLQRITEKIILRLTGYAKESHDLKNLCLAGGVVLNCVGNESIFLVLPFENVFIPSASHDGGTAIGAAYYIWNQILRKKRNFVYDHAYWGPEYSNEEIEKTLKKYKMFYKKVPNIEKEVARLIAKENIVSWFQGRLEFGPRALGNRSILADARNGEIVDLLNYNVKWREWFRPFAPSVLEEKMGKFFYIKKVLISDRFMLFAVGSRYPEKLPAVTHIDETARVQSVDKKTNPRYYKMIEEFGKITGVPVILNTSFNVQEPIVCSPEDAVKTFLRSNIDYLAIGDYLAHKTSFKTPWSGIEKINLEGKPAKKLMTVLTCRGCEWASKGKGPCTMCNFWIQRDKNISVDAIIDQFKKELARYDFKKKQIREIAIFNSGSFFNDNEMPEKARIEITKAIAQLSSVKNVVVESRPEYIEERSVKKLKKILGEKDLEIAIGLESSDNFIREKVINKGFDLKDFENTVKVIKKTKSKLRVYVLIKPLILTEKETIKDAIQTTKYVFKVGKKMKVETEIQLEPVFVKPPSLVFTAWKKDQYRAAWLWSVVEIIKEVSKYGKIHVGIDPEGMNWNEMPRNCEKCTPKFIEAIKKFNMDQKTNSLKRLKCECVEKWRRDLGEKPLQIKERVRDLLGTKLDF